MLFRKDFYIAYDGIQYGNRVDSTTERKLHAKVVDNILTGQTYISRVMSQGKPFMGKTYDIPLKIINSGAGEFFTGLETLNSAASDTTIVISFAHTAFEQPEVSILVESMANAGETGTIDLDMFKHEEAAAEAVQRLGAAIYGTGSGSQPLGLGAIVDDGTTVGTIGGQSRTTYPTLKATVTASGGTLTLAKLATLEDTISAASLGNEEPSINLTTKAVWSLYESLLQPSVRNNYEMYGGSILPNTSNQIVPRKESGAIAGMTSLAYRGKPVIKDDAAGTAASGTWFMLNERYLNWMGRTIVPDAYSQVLEKVNLGTNMKTLEGTGAETMPSEYNGWFYQPKMMLPNQAGMIGRYYVFGQFVCSAFRRQGKLTGITSV